jgi:hypothetical protein
MIHIMDWNQRHRNVLVDHPLRSFADRHLLLNDIQTALDLLMEPVKLFDLVKVLVLAYCVQEWLQLSVERLD